MAARSGLLVCAALVAIGCQSAVTVAERIERREARPQPSGFVPPGARSVGRWAVPAGGGVPRQLLVHWDRGSGERFQREHGLVLWQQHARAGQRGRWRRVYSRNLGGEMSLVTVERGDVTGDGHAELLVAQENGGTGGCGPKRVLATVEGRTRDVFRRWTCDTSFSLRGGALVRWSGRYTAHDAHCCPTFTRKTAYRWTGRAFRSAGSELYWNCIERRCLKWRRGPLRFRPRDAASWDARRGVATGGARPWLFARTVNRGKTWAIVDAAPCRLGAPRVRGPGRATVEFLDCDTEAGRFRRAVTRDFGRTWSAVGGG